eukprot:TRINITY_DN20781_c0_g1::TRINITY_DN20781_c0_g1_i1::g.10734::m.10734 TRINITY_DN20781_c0_g1::TRINITY_DN20781_c0_g1_i1::g.10734  ORF type:complete len:140 (-),score=0.28 TRINITY_DN20781_c0_g1_i1:8-427(-)
MLPSKRSLLQVSSSDQHVSDTPSSSASASQALPSSTSDPIVYYTCLLCVRKYTEPFKKRARENSHLRVHKIREHPDVTMTSSEVEVPVIEFFRARLRNGSDFILYKPVDFAFEIARMEKYMTDVEGRILLREAYETSVL